MQKPKLIKKAVLLAACMVLTSMPAAPAGGADYISESLGDSQGIISVTSAGKLTMAQVNSRTYTLSQRGDPIRERERARMALEMISLDATGYSLQPGGSVTVTVSSNSTNNYPRIYFQSFEGNGWHSWINQQQLRAGTQAITLPADHPGAAAIFFQNHYFPSQQGAAPIVTIEGGTRHPIYIHGETNPTTFRTEVNNHTGNNIAVAVSDNAIITTSNSGMKSGLDLTHGRGFSISNVMDAYENLYWEFNTTLSGYDMDAPFGTGDAPRGGKIVATAFAGVGYANGAAAGGGLTGYNSSNNSVNPGGAGSVVNYPQAFHHYTITHELGHQWETADLRVTNGKTATGTVNWGGSEITNLVHQEYGQYFLGMAKTQFDSRFEEAFAGQGAPIPNYHVNRPNPIHSNSREEQTFMAIAIYQILLAYDYEAFGRAAKDVRLNPEKYYHVDFNGERFTQANSPARWENMVLSLSNAVGRDLTQHFAHYHIPVSAAAKNKAGVNLLPVEERKVYYAAPFKNRQSEASAFKNAGVQVTQSGTTLNITGAGADEILCYEVMRNNRLVAVVYPPNGQTQATWTGLQAGDVVIAYDRAFQPHSNYIPGGSGGVENAKAPNITRHPGDLSVDVGETAALTVASSVTRGTISYQWYEVPGRSYTGGTPINGATSATYNPPTSAKGTKYYYCAVTNTDNSVAGSKTATANSNVAAVVVGDSGIIIPTYADVNDDGVINAADVTMLRRYLAATNKVAFEAENPRFNKHNADVNGDSVIDNKDVELLRRYLAATDPSNVHLGS